MAASRPFDDSFSKMITCSICLDILRTPIMSTNCLHKFCETCIKTWLQQTKHCAMCRKKVFALKQDPFVEESVQIYYAQNPDVQPRERCAEWTSPDPLAPAPVVQVAPPSPPRVPRRTMPSYGGVMRPTPGHSPRTRAFLRLVLRLRRDQDQ